MQIKNPLDVVIEHVASVFQNKLAPQKYSEASCTNLCFTFHFSVSIETKMARTAMLALICLASIAISRNIPVGET